MFNRLCCTLLLLLPLSASAQSSLYERVQDYVATYKDIAIEEMEKSGIPASIKLAQAIQESAFGTSELAKNARNHFGIKCADWDGPTYYKMDDEAHKSCFRVYDDPEQSFRDHTTFLTTRSHYAFLFEYESTDYKRWARGLRKAGYATDPKYATKIIRTIDEYKLAQYDLPGAGGETTEEVEVPPFQGGIALREKTRSFLFQNYKKGIFNRNRSAFFVAQPNETALAAAVRMGIPYARFLKFNDLKDGDVLIDYQYCFIQPKKKSFHGKEDVHEVKKDERMYEIAQFYGIDLEHLYKLNKLQAGQEPENGALIYLKKEHPNRPKLRPQNHQDQMPAPSTGAPASNKPPTDSTNTPKPNNPQTNVPPRPRDTLALNTPTYPSNVYEGGYLNTSENGEGGSEPPSWVENTEGNTFPEPQDSSRTPEPAPPTETTTEPETPEAPPAETEQPPETERPQPAPAVQTYTVQSGDGLWGIARKHDVTVDELKAFNGLTNNTISPGQVLRIPPKEGQQAPPAPAPEQSPSGTVYKMYEVQPGDSLWRIANKFGLTVDKLKAVNGLSGNTISPGKLLKVPQ